MTQRVRNKNSDFKFKNMTSIIWSVKILIRKDGQSVRGFRRASGFDTLAKRVCYTQEKICILNACMTTIDYPQYRNRLWGKQEMEHGVRSPHC